MHACATGWRSINRGLRLVFKCVFVCYCCCSLLSLGRKVISIICVYRWACSYLAEALRNTNNNRNNKNNSNNNNSNVTNQLQQLSLPANQKQLQAAANCSTLFCTHTRTANVCTCLHVCMHVIRIYNYILTSVYTLYTNIYGSLVALNLFALRFSVLCVLKIKCSQSVAPLKRARTRDGGGMGRGPLDWAPKAPPYTHPQKHANCNI